MIDEFKPVPPLSKNQLRGKHTTSKGVDEVRMEMQKMHKPMQHYDEYVDPDEIQKHRKKMLMQEPEMD